MYIKIGELKVDRAVACYDELVEALEEAGYILILESEGTTETCYIIARK